MLARDGRYVIIAFLQGSRAELDMRGVLGKRLTLTGSTLRPQTPDEKATIADEIRTKVLPLLELGRVRPIIDSVFPLARAHEAHALMESSRHMGKIVLDVEAEADPGNHLDIDRNPRLERGRGTGLSRADKRQGRSRGRQGRQSLPAFTAVDENGAPLSSGDLKGRPSVLLFVRGTWCPFCSRQVRKLTQYYRQINESGRTSCW